MKQRLLLLFILAMCLSGLSAFGYDSTAVPSLNTLLFSVNTDALPASGNTGNWPSFYPSGASYLALGTPTVTTLNGIKWEKNTISPSTAFRVLGSDTYATAIPCSGATIVVAVKPIQCADATNNWRSIVDIFRDELVLGVQNNVTSNIYVRRANATQTGPAIPDGQTCVLSMVVQTDGSYVVYKNGTSVMTGAATGANSFVSLDPAQYNNATYARYINLGRNNGDGWATFNGCIGDAFVYTSALSTADRQTLEALLTAKFGASDVTYTVTASAGTGGTISPSGSVVVGAGADKTFTVTPNTGYAVSDVVVDGTDHRGAVTSVTLNNITANGHTVAASFNKLFGIFGNVSDANGALFNATVTLSANADGSSPLLTTTTDASGNYAFYPSNINATYYLIAKKSVHVTSAVKTVVMSGADVTAQNFVLTKNAPVKLVDLDASGLTTGTGALTTWTNTGALGGTFTAATPLNVDNAATAFGKQAVWFAGTANNQLASAWSTSTVVAPSALAGSDVQYSVAAWLYEATTSTGCTYLNFGDNNPAGSAMWFNFDNRGWGAVDHGSGVYMGWGSLGYPATGVWHLIVCNYDGYKEDIYVDGALRSTASNRKMTPAARTMLVGCNSYKGYMAQLQVWDQPMSSADILAKYNSEKVVQTVTGTVTDPIGNPVPNAVIAVKTAAQTDVTSGREIGGTADATNYYTANASGVYSVNIPAGTVCYVSAFQTPWPNNTASGNAAGSVNQWKLNPSAPTTVSLTAGATQTANLQLNWAGSDLAVGKTAAANQLLAIPAMSGAMEPMFDGSFTNSQAWYTDSTSLGQRDLIVDVSDANGNPVNIYGVVNITNQASIWSWELAIESDAAPIVSGAVNTSATWTTVYKSVGTTGGYREDGAQFSNGTRFTNPVLFGAPKSVRGLRYRVLSPLNGECRPFELMALGTPPVYHKLTVVQSTGGTITPSTTAVVDGASQTFTIAANLGYKITNVLLDGQSQGAVKSLALDSITNDHTISATFVAVPQHTVSGKVTNKATGAGIAGASVYLSQTPNAFVSPIYTATTDASGNYTVTVYDGEYYACAVAANYYPSADKLLNITANAANVSFAVTSNVRHTPQPDQLLFSALTDVLPNSGNTGNWATDFPVGGTLTAMATPDVEIINGQKWEKNLRADFDGFVFGSAYTNPIPVNGATIVAAVRPTRNATFSSDGWNSVVDIFYDRLVLSVRTGTGLIQVRRNGSITTSTTAIPDGQMTVLSLVVQPDGSYKVYANGAEAAFTNNAAIAGGFTSLVPSAFNRINVGRNNPDTWSAFNGNIGDVFVYKTALPDADRTQLENELANKFGFLKKLTGKVVASDQTPVAGARVKILKGTATTDTGVDTAADGSYTIYAPLSPGAYQVTATKVNCYDATIVDLDVADGTETYSVPDIIMDPFPALLHVSGTVTDSITGQPAANVKLLLTSQSLSQPYNVQTDSNGQYGLDVLFGIDLTISADPAQTPKVVMLTPLADRYTEYLMEDWTANLSISMPSTVSGKVVTTDGADPVGFNVVAVDPNGVVAGTATTGVAGTYNISVMPGQTYNVLARKAGYITQPGPQAVQVVYGNTNYAVADFTAAPANGTISGILKDASGPINNGVVQAGGPNGPAVVTDSTGAFTVPAYGCGGAEIYCDAINHTGRQIIVTGGSNGNYKKDIVLVAVAEPNGLDGNMEDLVGDQPAQWLRNVNGTAGSIDWFASSTAKTGAQSLFYTPTATPKQYDGIYKSIALTPNCTYNFYFSTKADPEVAKWQPLFEFHDAADKGVGNYVSHEANPHGEYSHVPYYDWHTYFNWTDRAANVGAPVRRTPPATATTAQFIFLYEASDANNINGNTTGLPIAGKGCYIDDLVIDAVPNNLPFETVVSDPVEPPSTSVATLAELMAKAGTGETVKLTTPISVTCKGTSVFFVGAERYKGCVKVEANGKSIAAITAGKSAINLTGIVSKDGFGQYTLKLSADASANATDSVIKPVGMNNKSAKTDTKTWTNLVKVWGTVSGATITDGYSDPITLVDSPANGAGVVITGVLWRETTGVVLYCNH